MESYFPYLILALSLLSGVLGLILLVSVFRSPQRQDEAKALPPNAARALPAAGSPAPLQAAPLAGITPPPTEPAMALAGALQAMDGLRLAVAAASDPGYIRELNEDCLLMLDLNATRQSQQMTAHLFAIADGMGGRLAGEIASALATRALAEAVSHELLAVPAGTDQAPTPDYPAVLRQALEQANAAIREAASDDRRGMGTTLVAALVLQDSAYLANVGDSRAYLVTAGDIRQITVDHSLVEHLVATDQITREEARTHPERHLVYRSLGLAPEVEVDTFVQPLAPGQWLLLCSDGLNTMIPDPDIQAIVAAAPNPHAAATALVERAKAAGGEDNITTIVIRVEEARAS